MIVKKIRSKATNKTSRIEGLADYIESELAPDGKEKCVYRGSRNFLCTDPKLQQLEMLELALSNPNSKMPVEHFVFSWQAGEHPTPQQIEEAVDIFLGHIGMEDHQIIYALHNDTENTHLHVMLNRVHPETEKALNINNGFDIKAIHQVCARIEHAQGWMPKQNAMYVMENGNPVENKFRDIDPLRPHHEKAAQKELFTGEQSAERRAKTAIVPALTKARSWVEFHALLAKNGVRYEKKGSGALVLVAGETMKASTACRDAGLSKLEKRFGVFVPAPANLKITDVPTTVLMPAVKRKDWESYQGDKERWFREKKSMMGRLKAKHETERKAFADHWRKQWKETFTRSWQGRGHERNALSSVFAAQKAVARIEMMERQKLERQAQAKTFPPYPQFRQWLEWQTQERQKEEELKLKKRAADLEHRALAQTASRTIAIQDRPADIRDFKPTPTGLFVEYRKGDVTAFVDHGQKITLQQNNSDAVLAMLQLSQAKWPGGFTITGDGAFKTQCVQLAAQHGFKITNPELQDGIELERKSLQEQRFNRREPAVTKEQQATKEQPKPGENREEQPINRSDLRLQFARACRDMGLGTQANLATPGLPNEPLYKIGGKERVGLTSLTGNGQGMIVNFETGQTFKWEYRKGIVQTIENDPNHEHYRANFRTPLIPLLPEKEKAKEKERGLEL